MNLYVWKIFFEGAKDSNPKNFRIGPFLIFLREVGVLFYRRGSKYYLLEERGEKWMKYDEK